MKIYLGVTDNNWYNYLSNIQPEDINFWQPGGKSTFKVLSSGGPFLLKLKSPINKIGDIGFFSSHTFLPINVAWDVFNERTLYQSLLHALHSQSGFQINATSALAWEIKREIKPTFLKFSA